jgi:ABC-type hemin transport system ATPase subunit
MNAVGIIATIAAAVAFVQSMYFHLRPVVELSGGKRQQVNLQRKQRRQISN